MIDTCSERIKLTAEDISLIFQVNRLSQDMDVPSMSMINDVSIIRAFDVDVAMPGHSPAPLNGPGAQLGNPTGGAAKPKSVSSFTDRPARPVR